MQQTSSARRAPAMQPLKMAPTRSSGGVGLAAGRQQPVAQEQPTSGQVKAAGAGTGADTGAGADAERVRQLRVAE